MRVEMNIEETDSSDTNNANAEISNEGKTTITNKQKSFKYLDTPMLLHRDEGKKEMSGEKLCVTK